MAFFVGGGGEKRIIIDDFDCAFSSSLLVLSVWLWLTIGVHAVARVPFKRVSAPLVPCSLGLFCPPAAAVSPHYSQSAK